MKFASVAGLLLAALLAALPGAPAQAAAPVAKIQAMLAKPDQLCGRFEQSKQLAGMKKPLASSGRFCVVAGKGVLWRTLKPFANTLRLSRDEIVQLQGERVAMRMEASREPTVRMINGVLFSLLSGDLGQLESLFDVDGTAADGAWKVTLKARNPALAKAIGTLTLDGGAYVRTIHMVEESGDRTDIVFSDIKAGPGAVLPEEAAQL
jgi:outer membrane lipoprotein-sorting protein